MKYSLRPRQQEAVDNMVSFINSKTTKKGIFVYPTSFGKALVVANVAPKFPDKFFINVTSSKELVKQNYEKFISYGYEASICSASLGSKDVGKITFATVGTLVKQVDFFKDKEVIILSDECHIGAKKGSQLQKFVDKVKNCKLIGTTATPLRLKQTQQGTELKMMNRDRDCFYTSIEDVVQISEVVEQGYWSKLDYEVRDTDESALELNTTGSDYTLESLQKYTEENSLIEQCYEEINKLISQGRKSILVFVPFIQNALDLEAKLEDCRAVYSGMDNKERDYVIDSFKSLEISVVVQCQILVTGFDHPQLDAIIFARPTNSITIWYQGLGRGVRMHENKKDCKVIDLSGNYNKFGRIEDINFENDKAYGGWAAFSGDRLLTNYPLGHDIVPTKQTLKEAYQNKQEVKSQTSDPMFNFGKYKGKKVSQIMKEQGGKSYLAWITDPKTKFNFFGEAGIQLKTAIFKALNIVPPVEKKEYKTTATISNSTNHKEAIENYTSGIKTLADLSGVF